MASFKLLLGLGKYKKNNSKNKHNFIYVINNDTAVK